MRIPPAFRRPANQTPSRTKDAAFPHPTFDAVALSGGGMKGIAMLGSLVEFQNAGWLSGVTRFAGTSVGAVLAAILALDRPLDATYRDHVEGFRYASTYDLGGLDKTFGLDRGDGLQAWIDAVLREPITFRELRVRRGSTLLVCASNLNTRSAVIFGPDTHPDMDVGTALRMSCSIPLYFAATHYKKELYVDGALTDNFPVEAASDHGRLRVLGVRAVGAPKPPGHVWGLESFMGALVECGVTRPVPRHLQDMCLVCNINAGAGTQPMHFSMPPDRMRKIFDAGKAQARDFVALYRKKLM